MFKSIESYYITSGSITVNGPGIITVLETSVYSNYYCGIQIDDMSHTIYLKPSDTSGDGRVVLFKNKAIVSVKGSGTIGFAFSIGLFN